MPSSYGAFERHSAATILQPGRNCWRIEHAKRFCMLVDADSYFRAVRAAIRSARHSVFILGWDIDSRMRLVPEGARDGYPECLSDFLHAMVKAKPDLHIHVLNWDFSMLYALEREWMPASRLGWHTDPRLNFRMDAHHPVGGSHHQKVVVIDDCLAFVGGLDLTGSRWDTPEHEADCPWRRDRDGKPYGPFHDVQTMVDGGVARALGELARQRWSRATGDFPEAVITAGDQDVWPAGFTPDIVDVDIAIARTDPAYEGRNGIFELRQLHLDAIASADRSLFFENQYFTSDVICRALAARLEEQEPPEIMIVSPKSQSGWLEQATMGVLRARVHHRLKAADRTGRYRMYCPELPGLDKNQCLNVHSKVFTVDDNLLCIGSANLSNRSMALDTECSLVIEATGARGNDIRHAIRTLRNRLLAEHVAADSECVESAVQEHGLHGAAARLRRPDRWLAEFEPAATPEMEALVPPQAVFDPERPISPDELIAQLVPKDARRPVPRRIITNGLIAGVLALLAIAWRWTPISEWINLASLVGAARSLEALPFTPIAVVGSYAIAGLLVPVMLLIAVTGIVFGPVAGAFYAIGGSVLSAVLTYAIGAALGKETVHRLVGARINRLSRRIAKQGIVAMVVLRILPVAPFTVVNVIAGASHIKFRDYFVGTILGMSPGIVMTVTFSHHLAEAVRNPTPNTVAVLAMVAALLVGTAMGLQRLLGNK